MSSETCVFDAAGNCKVTMPDDFNKQVVSLGSTALVTLHASNTHVEKAPHPGLTELMRQSDIRDLQREYAAYQRLPRHPRLLYLHPDSVPERLVLPYLRKGCLRQYLSESAVSPVQRLQFAADAAEGLHLLHTASIVHSDINAWNFLIDDDDGLCIIDFAGSTIDVEAGSGLEGAHYCFPRPWRDTPTVRTDLFALGCLIYEISTGRKPWQDCDDEEVEARYRRHEFPVVQDLPLGRIMLGCWQGAFETAQRVHEDIRSTSDEIRR